VAIFLTRDDGTRTLLGHALPEVCCGHADEDDELGNPQEGRLMFNYISPNGENFFARYSGVEITLGETGPVIFKDTMPRAALPALRALLVEDPANGFAGYAPLLKRNGQHLQALAGTAATSDELHVITDTAKRMYDLLLGREDSETKGVYDAFNQILAYARMAAQSADAKPSLPLRLKDIESLFERVVPTLEWLVVQTWSTAFYTRTPHRAKREAQELLTSTDALRNNIDKLYKLCQQMSWLALAVKV